MHLNTLLKGEELCKECGLCCEGVFHTFAYLQNQNDILLAKKANIAVYHEEKKNLDYFSLPCPAFNGSCSVFPNRPSVCSEHKCKLLHRVHQEEISLDRALKVVFKMKETVENLIPSLKALSGTNELNNPKYLMDKILYNAEDPKKLKEENKKLFMLYGVFSFLKERYFYDGIAG